MRICTVNLLLQEFNCADLMAGEPEGAGKLSFADLELGIWQNSDNQRA